MRYLKLMSAEAKRASIAVAMLTSVVQVLVLGAMFQPMGEGMLI
jgi:hypothetical protein